MSYNIDTTDPFISVKLTEKGREKLAQGKLDYKFWALGDSEINYNREAIVDANPTDVTLSASTMIMRPQDKQPNLKYFVSTGSTFLNTLTAGNIQTIKAVIDNEATPRGFFSGTTDNYTTLTGSSYIKSTGTLSNSLFTGGSALQSGVINASVGDTILFKLSNGVLGTVPMNSNTEPIPHLFYKIQASGSTDIILDRPLPDIDTPVGADIQYVVYPQGEVATAFGSGATAYWNTQTLNFNSGFDASIADVPVWNMNNVWGENIAGITGSTYEDYTKFGSYPYLGAKDPYLGLGVSGDTSALIDICSGNATADNGKKSVALIHYTNNTINNFYGEFLHIDTTSGKIVKLHLPDLMYHRRSFSGGTATGDKMGMSFVSSGSIKTISATTINYYDLIEDATLISSASTPSVVGKVFPQLKMVVVDDEEIVAALSYKSNRNWTLPELTPSLAAPSGGTSTGSLDANQTMYLTYGITNTSTSGLTSALPCQKYTKVVNGTAGKKDVEFRINAVDELPYMRKTENAWDGRGFYGNNLKVLYQIVNSVSERPNTANWKEVDFNGVSLTTSPGETIDPVALENQNPTVNGFRLTYANTSGATTYSAIDDLNMVPNISPEILQFGDEKFFYGNLETHIGATIYKTIFKINPNSSQFNTTSNPTRSKDLTTNPPVIRISEVGIYDSASELIGIGKLSRPAKLDSGATIMIELSLDF